MPRSTSVGFGKLSVPSLREALDTQTSNYIRDHFHEGVATVFSDPESSSTFTVLIVANKYNPSNFWSVVHLHCSLVLTVSRVIVRSGRWRSQYVIDLANGTIKGKVLINVHYYEQGNVRDGCLLA